MKAVGLATHGWREVETQTYRTCYGTLPGSIRAKDHVKVWTRLELDKVVGEEVL